MFIGKSFLSINDDIQEMNRINNIVKLTKNENNEFTKESYEALKQENGDLVGYIIFDSEIIEQPVVQSYDNDYYLRRKFDKTWSDNGVPFMDAYCTTSSTNMTIYGHSSYLVDTFAFTPLNKMIDQSFFDQNKKFKIYMEDGIHYYEGIYVYRISEEEFQDYDFARADFYDENDFNQFIDYAKQKSVVNSRNVIEYGNKFVTLQTCELIHEDVRTIVVAKELMIKDYD